MTPRCLLCCHGRTGRYLNLCGNRFAGTVPNSVVTTFAAISHHTTTNAECSTTCQHGSNYYCPADSASSIPYQCPGTGVCPDDSTAITSCYTVEVVAALRALYDATSSTVAPLSAWTTKTNWPATGAAFVKGPCEAGLVWHGITCTNDVVAYVCKQPAPYVLACAEALCVGY
jgi:hypothetical protein